MLQKLWLQKEDWDEEFPDVISKYWRSYVSDCKQLQKLKITRYLGTTRDSLIEIHDFCNGSMDAYGTVIYLKTINRIGEAQV